MHSPDENSGFKQITFVGESQKITFIPLTKQKENYFKVRDFFKKSKTIFNFLLPIRI